MNTGRDTEASPPAAPGDHPQPPDGARSLLRLLSWLSPSFPVGAFSHSHGLEQVISREVIRDGETAFSWISALLEFGGGWSDAVLLKEAFQAARAGDGARLQATAELAEALCPSAERLRETQDQGQAFLTAAATWATATAASPPPLAAAPYPVAVGLCAAAAGAPLGDVLLAYLHAFASNLVTIAVRAVPLGQTAGITVLARLEDTLIATAVRAAASTLDDLGGCALASDVASMGHETLETRIFIS